MGVDEVRILAWSSVRCGLLFLTIGLVACDDTQEGCLDYRALQVDLYAEEGCDDCCTYPGLGLQQLAGHVVRDTIRSITPTTYLVGSDGDSTRITALVYFLHDLELEFADGRVYPLTDTFSFRQNSTDPFVLETRSLLRGTPFRRSLLESGQLLEEGSVVALRLKFGLPGEYTLGQPAAQTNNLPLALGQDSLLFDRSPGRLGGYRSAYIRTLDVDGRADSSWVSGGASIPLRFALPTQLDLARSLNLNLTLYLPVTPLADLPGGPVDAGVFAGAFLTDARIVSVSTSR